MAENKNIDWNEMWKHARDNSSYAKIRKLNGLDAIEGWNKAARRYNESMQYSDYSARIVSKLDIDSECTVLDIGAGPGTLTVPLATIAKSITAVEPSTEMLECLTENAASAGLENIIYINKRWEDAEVDSHDVVVASHSIGMMQEVRDALSKINDVAKRSVHLFAYIGGRMMEDYNDLWLKLYGEEYNQGPNYTYIYNILHGMGIHANIDIFQYEDRRLFSSFDDAVDYWREFLYISSSNADKEKIIRKHLSETLEEVNGGFESRYKSKSAMIWWKKE